MRLRPNDYDRSGDIIPDSVRRKRRVKVKIMNKEDAIRILTDELKHTEIHLQDKNKAPEFYEEMRDYCEAARMAIKVLKIFDSVREEKGDTISREALKEEFLKYKPYAVDFLSLINNAPTVYPKQGEWIKKQVTPASCIYVCSECGIEEVILGNFCCWCGADMRGDNNV